VKQKRRKKKKATNQAKAGEKKQGRGENGCARGKTENVTVGYSGEKGKEEKVLTTLYGKKQLGAGQKRRRPEGCKHNGEKLWYKRKKEAKKGKKLLDKGQLRKQGKTVKRRGTKTNGREVVARLATEPTKEIREKTNKQNWRGGKKSLRNSVQTTKRFSSYAVG